MNKSTISTLILAVAAAGGVLYALGLFDNSPSSVTIDTNVIESGSEPMVSEASITITQKEVTPVQTTPTPTPKSVSLTKAEVAKHATKSDCWMIVSNNVYNFSQYIVVHPGGQGAIVRECGMDGTKTFLGERKHLQPNIEAELATYLLGALE